MAAPRPFNLQNRITRTLFFGGPTMTIQATASQDGESTVSARRVAEHATFQSFANCYLREIDGGARVRHSAQQSDAFDCLECVLPAQRAALRVELLSASLCGPHRLGRCFMKRALETAWRETLPLNALQALLHEAYRRVGDETDERLRGCELELLARVLDSYQTTLRFLETPAPDLQPDSFIEAEQSLTFGHWLHPTPKSRQGMTSWQQPVYSPELGGSFRLVFFAAAATLVRSNSAAREGVSGIVEGLAGRDLEGLGLRGGEALLPMHPLQAEALMLDPDVEALCARGALRLLGSAGPAFTATSSVRTVWSAEAEWMLKFSLPVRITNSVRTNRRHELEAGVAMARLFQRSDFLRRHPKFRLLRDPAFVTLDIPGRSESGFETIFRENPFRASAEDAVTLAALTAEPALGERSRLERIIRALAVRESEAAETVALRWFAAYLDCALDPLLALYDELGVALEAHQQNSLLDIRSGYPTACWYRDSQGFYLSNAYRGRLRALAPETEDVAHLYYDDAEIQDPFAYYLVVNQIFSVVTRLGHDGLADEAELLAMIRARLGELARRLTGAGRAFARTLLDRPTIAAKANLVTRLYDIDELAAGDENAKYQRLPNPLSGVAATARGGDRALAV